MTGEIEEKAMSMDYTTFEAVVDHGQISVKDSAKLPEQARGLLILFPLSDAAAGSTRTRVVLPLIKGDGQRIIDPTPEELDASAWD
jgi:hypothetical protein